VRSTADIVRHKGPAMLYTIIVIAVVVVIVLFILGRLRGGRGL
jgi:Na+/H+ antiporter NhaC